MSLSGFVRTCFLLVLSTSACAEKSRLQSRSPVQEKNRILAGGKNESAAEQPLWTIANTPMKLSCEPPPRLGFKASAGFSEANKYMLARFAMIGQESFQFDAVFLQNYFKKAGFLAVKTFEDKAKGVQGFVATHDKANLVVFRGTHSAGGFMTDLNFLLSGNSFLNMPGGLHGGFKTAFDSVQPMILSALNSPARSNVPTYFVGHSLGGALAMLGASDALGRGFQVGGLITLGQPRTGNRTFAESFSSALNEKYFRYVHKNDLVPHLPPSSSAAGVAAPMIAQNELLRLGIQSAGLLRFTHVGVPRMLGTAAEITTAAHSDELWDTAYWRAHGESVRQSVSTVLNSNGGTAAQTLSQNKLIADHDVNQYLCEMLKLVK